MIGMTLVLEPGHARRMANDGPPLPQPRSPEIAVRALTEPYLDEEGAPVFLGAEPDGEVGEYLTRDILRLEHDPGAQHDQADPAPGPIGFPKMETFSTGVSNAKT